MLDVFYFYELTCVWTFLLFFKLFFYLQEELASGEEIATCPSCSLIVKVIYDLVSFISVHFYVFNSQYFLRFLNL